MDYNIKVTPQELTLIGQALGELPFKAVQGLITNLTVQVKQQEQAAQAALASEPLKEPISE